MTGVDEAAERRVRNYAAAVLPDLSTESIAQVRPLDGGQNHDVYRLSLVGRVSDVVVRIGTSEHARDCATAEREAQVLRSLAGASAPVLHDFRCQSLWFDVPTMCMDFVDGTQRPPRGVADAKRLGVAVAAVHALEVGGWDGWPPADGTLTNYLDDRITKMDERMRWVGSPIPLAVQDRLRRARASLDEIRRYVRNAGAFRQGGPLVLLHGDVAGGNLVWTPTPVLIDWEYARLSDAADEVAYIFNQNDFGHAERRAFWRGYQQRDGAEHLVERVRWWEPVTVLGSAFFWMEAWSRRASSAAVSVSAGEVPHCVDYYAEQTLLRLERTEALLRSLTR